MSALPPKAEISIGSNYVRRSSGSLAMFAANRRASSRNLLEIKYGAPGF
jgi:hypothetical protein